jgi:hypothetical protein
MAGTVAEVKTALRTGDRGPRGAWRLGWLVVAAFVVVLAAVLAWRRDDVSDLRRSYAALDRIYAAKDWDALREIYASDYYLLGADGIRYPFWEEFERFKQANSDPRARRRSRPLSFKVEGDEAVVQVRTEIVAPSFGDRDGQMRQGESLSWDHWRRKGGGWELSWSESKEGLWLWPKEGETQGGEKR